MERPKIFWPLHFAVIYPSTLPVFAIFPASSIPQRFRTRLSREHHMGIFHGSPMLFPALETPELR